MLYNKYFKMHKNSSFQYKGNMAMLAISSLLISISELIVKMESSIV